jgi:hypothetical protein
MMDDSSGYLKYLPAALWETAASSRPLPLGQMLRVFEKILTGIDDDVVVRKGDRAYASLQEVIARNSRHYGPWTAPYAPPQPGDRQSTPLDYLAQWVALQFAPNWNEYLRRKATSEIVQIYAQRGTRDGLNKLIDVHATSSERPRVVIDDGSKLLFTRPQAGPVAPIYTLVSQLPLISPTCLTLAPDGTLFVGDLGNSIDNMDLQGATLQRSTVWALSTSGQYLRFPEPTADNPLPAPVIEPRSIGPDLTQFQWTPTAVAADRRAPYGIFVLDSLAQLRRFSRTHLYVTADEMRHPFATPQQLQSPQRPAAMLVDQNGDVMILDDGGGKGLARLLHAHVGGNPPVWRSTEIDPLPTVTVPMSMVQLTDGTLVVGDAAPPDDKAAILWRLDLRAGTPARQLLDNDPDRNPLAAPVAIIEEDKDHLLVLDIGLKPLKPETHHYEPQIARQAVIYRVDIATRTVTPATEMQQMVYPRGMVRGSDGTVYVCDSGLPDLDQGFHARVWRSVPQAFTATVHFPGGPKNSDVRNRFLETIRTVIEDERPVQSLWKLQPDDVT